jgi:hypothetical protein
MNYARKIKNTNKNSILATLIAYDLQAGSYIEATRKDPNYSQL